MRIHELAKEINVHSNDVIEVMKKIDSSKEYKAASGIKDEDIAKVRARLKGAADHSAARQTEAAKPAKEMKQAESKQTEAPKQAEASKQTSASAQTEPQAAKPQRPATNAEIARQTAAANAASADEKKAHITQVYNPQNSSRNQDGRRYDNNRQGGYNRNNGQGGQGSYNRPNNGQGGQGGYNRPNNGQGGQGSYNRPNNGQGGQGGYNRPNNGQGGQGGYNRPNNGQGGYNRPNNGQGGYNRPNNGQGGQGGYNRPNNGQGGYNRPNNGQGGQGGYNRPNNGQGGQGGYNRPNNGQGGQGGYNRPNNGQGGYNRPNNGQGGYNRPNNGQGGYNRPNNGQGGFNRPGGGQGGFNRGPQGARREAEPKEDFTFEQKPDRRVDNRKNDKNDKEKRDREFKENLRFVNQKMPQKPAEKPEEVIKNLILPDTMTIKELADKMKVQPSVVVKKLFLQGKVVTINQEIDYDTAEEIALEFNCICDHEIKIDIIAELLKEDEEDEKDMVARPPVVCVMGHVDHGKTSLLDAIRSSNVTAKESGGITQKIGAYTVTVKGQKITFLDTPGHEAFTAMRMRGAQSTDIAILVVAADDGVMPQTVEAINHAKAAGIDIIVAINKIDKPNANIERVKQELTEYELISEDWGGSTIFVPVSAHTKEGIDTLLEMILLDAEVHELKANPNRTARGLVIEAQLDKGKGPVANILVQKGTLHVGDNIAAGSCYGKIRAMTDDKGNKVKAAGPSTPVEVLGLNDVPNAGEIIVETETDKEARSFAETFIRAGREKLLDDTKAKLSLDDLFTQIKAGNVKELGIIVKADVQGSVEAVKQSLVKLSNEEVAVKIVHSGVGNINESDVTLASASNAIIIGFNVKPDNQARLVADHEKVDMRLYKVIYSAIEDVEAALKGMLEPVFEEKVIGQLVIRQTYKASGVGTIAGCYVTDGRIAKNSSIRLKRGDELLYEGPIASLKRFKDDVKEVKEGYECGIVIEKFNNLQEDDTLEAYEMVEVPR